MLCFYHEAKMTHEVLYYIHEVLYYIIERLAEVIEKP